MARTTTNVQRSHYRLMHRTPESYTEPSDAATFATFLGTFTELGYCRDKTLQLGIETAEAEELDDGKELQLGVNGHLEGVLLQTEVADYTAYEAIENIAQDILLYAEVTGKCIFLPNALVFFKESVVSGEVEAVPFEYNAKNLATKAAFRSRFEEPLV